MSVRKKVVVTDGEEATWWIADYFDGTGHRHQRRFKTKKEAAAHHDSIKTAIRSGEHVALPADLTVSGAADKWLAKVEANDCEFGTLQMYRAHVRLHINPRIGNLKLAKMTKGHIEHFRDGLLSGDNALSRVMAKKVLVSLKSILKANGVAHLGDDVSVRIAERKEMKIEKRGIPTTVEVARLIEAAPMRWKTLLMVAVFTGLRASELRGLRWSDVDLKSGAVTVTQRADLWNNIGSPKSKGSRRTVPIGPELVRALKEWKLACPKGDLDLVFPTTEGKVSHHKNIMLALEAIMVKAGVVDRHGKPKYGLHCFRHFFASWCINRKADGGRELPPKTVQTLLGHSSITMTMDIYGHLFPTNADENELRDSERALLGASR
jgi:integrase